LRPRFRWSAARMVRSFGVSGHKRDPSGWTVVVMHRGRSGTVPLGAGGQVRGGRAADGGGRIDERRASGLHAARAAGQGAAGSPVTAPASQNGTALVAPATASTSGTGRASERRLEPRRAEPPAPGAMLHVGSAVLVVQGAEGRAGAAAPAPSGIVVRDPQMARLHELVARVAQSDLG